MNPMVMVVLKMLIPVLTPLLIGAIKQFASGAYDKIPEWLRPLLAAILGALAGIATGEVNATVDIAMNAAAGAALGSLGKAGRDAYREVRPAGVD